MEKTNKALRCCVNCINGYRPADGQETLCKLELKHSLKPLVPSHIKNNCESFQQDNSAPSFNIQIRGECIAEFFSYGNWVNSASRLLGGHNKRKYQLICLDNEGYLCHIGEDFMAARDHNRFPVKAYLIKRGIFAHDPE